MTRKAVKIREKSQGVMNIDKSLPVELRLDDLLLFAVTSHSKPMTV